jgi:6-phosphogluconolactonase
MVRTSSAPIIAALSLCAACSGSTSNHAQSVAANTPAAVRSPGPTFVVIGLAGREYGAFVAPSIATYAVNVNSGALSLASAVPLKFASNNMVPDWSGRFVYLISIGQVSGYRINAKTGALALIPGSPFDAANLPAQDVALVATDKFVYVASVKVVGSTYIYRVAAYAVKPQSGALTQVPGSPFGAGVLPSALAADPTGKFLYVANNGSNNVSAYTIDATNGALTPVHGSPFAAGNEPAGIAADRTGRFVYVTNFNASTISAYLIDAGSGALTPVVGSPFATCGHPGAIVADPARDFLYVRYSSGICAYSIGAASGKLTPVAGSPFQSVSGFGGVAIDPAGKFVYRGNDIPHRVSAYSVNAASGALRPVQGAPYAMPWFTTGLAVTSPH